MFVFLIVSTIVLAQEINLDNSEPESQPQEEVTPQDPEQMIADLKKGIEEGTIEEERLPPPIRAMLKANPSDLKPVEPPNGPDIVSCFDYYTFNSITADIFASTDSAVSGMSMEFNGTLINNNPYPVVEGTLYVKVFKSTGPEKNPNGPDVIDQFVAVENINIPANGSVPVSFTWQVPAYAISGDYRLATFFTSDKKFNLLGLSFTDDVVGNEYLFTILGEQEGIMMFDKSSVVINDNPYYFAAYPPRIPKDQDAHISLTISNDTDEDQ